MKKAILFLLAALFLFINCLPSSIVFADDSGYTDSQLSDIGTLMLTSLISSGEATELDFSDYTQNDGLDFLVALGELAVTGDPSGLIDQGLSWLGSELDDAYQSLIEDIRAWEHDVAPDLYNWWYNGTQYEYKLVPNSNISRPLSNLLRAPNETIIPQPNPDYSFYLNYLSSNTWGVNGVCSLLNYSISNYSWQTISISNAYSYMNTTGTFMDNSAIYDLRILNPSSINIVTQGNSYFVSYSLSMAPSNTVQLPHGNFNYAYKVTINGNTNLCQTVANVNDLPSLTNTFSSMTECLSYLVQHFRYINLTVDNVPWIVVHDNTPTYPIVIPGTLTVLNNQPVEYSFPTPTYYDINNLKNLITNSINNSDVLTWQDIDDYFLDVNGVQALPTLNIIRNDYDNMYIEQYPYPAKLIGMQEPLTFNEHMLDNYYGQYLTPMVDVASNTIDVLPGEIKWVLGIGAILMIFAVIINRLLE